MLGNKRVTGRGGDGIQGLWEPSHSYIILQMSREGDLILGRQVGSGDVEYAEAQKKWA